MTKNGVLRRLIMCFTICFVAVSVFQFFAQNASIQNKSITKNRKIENGIKGFESNNELACDADVVMASSNNSGSIVIEQSSLRVLCADNENARCYPASTTKILTAYIALEVLEPDKLVTVPKEAAGIEGSSIYLKAGDQITVEDLLYGLMLRSGNDCAATLAIEACGSIESFAELMNKTATALGAKNSHFVNPHGLHDDMHYTTAYDLALICARAYDNRDFVRIVSTAQRKIVVSGEDRYIANKNKMLKLYEGANGVKTGYTQKSGRCLVSGAKRDGMQLLCVVLNHSDMWNDSVRMLDYCFDTYQMLPLDMAMLLDGERCVEVKIKQNVTPNWRDIYYPVRRDNSERLLIVSGR